MLRTSMRPESRLGGLAGGSMIPDGGRRDSGLSMPGEKVCGSYSSSPWTRVDGAGAPGGGCGRLLGDGVGRRAIGRQIVLAARRRGRGRGPPARAMRDLFCSSTSVASSSTVLRGRSGGGLKKSACASDSSSRLAASIAFWMDELDWRGVGGQADATEGPSSTVSSTTPPSPSVFSGAAAGGLAVRGHVLEKLLELDLHGMVLSLTLSSRPSRERCARRAVQYLFRSASNHK